MAERRSSAVDRAAQTNLETWKTAHPICLQTFVLCFFTVCFISCHLFIPKGCKAGSLCTFPEVLVVSWTIFGPSKGCSSATSCWDNCCWHRRRWCRCHPGPPEHPRGASWATTPTAGWNRGGSSLIFGASVCFNSLKCYWNLMILMVSSFRKRYWWLLVTFGESNADFVADFSRMWPLFHAWILWIPSQRIPTAVWRKGPSYQVCNPNARTKAPPEGKTPPWPFRPWRTQEKRSFSRWVLPGTLPGDGKWFRWCPFCSSLKTNHQSTKAFKPKSVFNWLTGQVNSIKFLENAKSFYQTSAFASETGWEGRKKSFSQSLPFQGEFPVWDQFFTSQHCFFKDGKICRYFRRAIPGTNLVRLRSWMHPIE